MATPNNSRLKMILNPKDEETLTIFQEKVKQPGVILRGEKMNLPDIENRVGFRLMRPNLENVTLIATRWVGGFTSYYGKFSDGISARYQYGPNMDTYFTIMQWKIIDSNSPRIFNYPESVRAYQKYINNGQATIVIVPEEWLPSVISFAQWVVGDFMMLVDFDWGVEDSTVESVINSLQNEYN